MTGSPIVWTIFAVTIVTALAVDLGIFNRQSHTVTPKQAAAWTGVWMALALAFNGLIYQRSGSAKAMEFFQGWLLEYALSIDNVFVFLLIFRYFKIAPEHQHRVLFWGIIGAVVSRAVFIVLGTAVVSRFHFVMYILGAFLVYSGIKILRQKDDDLDPGKNPVLALFRRVIPTTDQYDGNKFVTRINGRLTATPLLVVLVVVEVSDIMFAVDSIPAVLGITKDVFIVFTSNIFAILGLRSLFFLIEALVQKLRFLKVGVAVILAFIGVKILIERWWHMPVAMSLGVLAGILLVATVLSLLFPSPAPATERP